MADIPDINRTHLAGDGETNRLDRAALDQLVWPEYKACFYWGRPLTPPVPVNGSKNPVSRRTMSDNIASVMQPICKSLG